MSHLEIYDQTQECINYIKGEMKEVYRICENARTIEKSNELYYIFLANAKKDAFKMIETSLHKPYVIYRVNRYFFI